MTKIEIKYPNVGIYKGEIKNNYRHGKGTMKWNDGGKYVGEWKNNVRHGKGTFSYPSGYKYVGEWKNGKQHGQGKESFVDSKRKRKKISKGKWYKGIFAEKKQFIYRESEALDSSDREKHPWEFFDIYEGEVKVKDHQRQLHLQRHGKGTMYYYRLARKRLLEKNGFISSDKDKLFFSYRRPSKTTLEYYKLGTSKKGLYLYKIYDGQWKDDQSHGKGKFIYLHCEKDLGHDDDTNESKKN